MDNISALRYIKWQNVDTLLRKYVTIFPRIKNLLKSCAKFRHSVTKAYVFDIPNKLGCLLFRDRKSPSIKYDSRSKISVYLAVTYNRGCAFFRSSQSRLRESTGRIVRFESERVTWLPQNDFHLVLSRQRDQFVRVSALAFDESFRQHGTVHTYGKPLLFHFPALRFLVLSRHSLAKVLSPFFLLREEINLVAFFSARLRSLVSFFACGIDHENSCLVCLRVG